MNEPAPTPPDAPENSLENPPESPPEHFPDDSPPQLSAVHHPWLERYLWLIAVVTFFLLILGGTVTSKGVGLSVPDWPHTYGYNMLTFPPSKWLGGIFWEHTHRLLATLVGFLTLLLMVWVMVVPRISMTLRIMGGVLLVLVSVQGLMGGLRVTEISTALGVVHGITGQLFFALILATAVMASKRWLDYRTAVKQQHQRKQPPQPVAASLAKTDKHCCCLTSSRLAWVFMAVLVIQLTLGATMRHYHAGLAIPDFPAAYGQVIPPFTTAGIKHAMDTHAGGDHQLVGYYSSFKVIIHFSHRVWAIIVVIGALGLVSILASRNLLKIPVISWLSMSIMFLLLVQITLGALIIWTGRNADVATAHQTTGAVILGVSTVLAMLLETFPSRIDESAQTPDQLATDPARQATDPAGVAPGSVKPGSSKATMESES